MQRELRAFAHSTHKKQNGCERENRPSLARENVHRLTNKIGERRKHFDVVKASSVINNHADAKRKAEITDTIDQKRLHIGENRCRAGIPKPDQQIGHQPNRLPAEEKLKEVVRHYQHHHREGEKRYIGEKALIAVIIFHVAHGVDVNAQGHTADHHHHHGSDRVDQKSDLELDLTDLGPLVKRAVKAIACQNIHQGHHRGNCRNCHQGDRDKG